jgi:hypothetical protein
MNTKIVSSVLILLFLFFLIAFGQEEMKEYKNETFRFSVEVPVTWRLHEETGFDAKKFKSIIDWGLPKVYSELENCKIENAISITAYVKMGDCSVNQLMKIEYLRIDPGNTALEVDSSCSNARMIYQTKNGLNYKGKSYFICNNDIGYVITFMATPGTYDININVFEEFYKRIKYY